MGVGATVFVITMVGCLAVVGVVVLVQILRDRPRDLSDTLADRIEQSAAGVHQVNGAPVVGVPALDQIDRLAPWDVDPHVDDAWRLGALRQIEAAWALPARERTS